MADLSDNINTFPQQQQELIPGDKYIILVDNRNQQRLIKLSTHKKFNWRKTQINITELLTHPFYQLLEVGNNTLKPIEFENPDDQDENDENNEQQQNNNGKEQQVKQNNKEMYTLQDAQKLQPQDIEKLRKQKTPQELINQLVENNQQFQKRTAYSKAKYLKKKQKKYSLNYNLRYIFNFHAQPVSLENLHEYYFKNDYKYIGGIRWDMLGLLLLHAGPIDRVLVSQRTKGIILGAALLRDANSVDFVSLEEKNIKNFPVIEQLNIDKEETKKVTFHTWETLKNNSNRPTGKFNSFILLGNFDFAEIIKTTEDLKLLSSNTSIAFFCHSLEPILECFNKMRKQYKNFLNVRIYDSWCREYQVLKNRTHPLMYMDSRSGYLLTAIRVDPR